MIAAFFLALAVVPAPEPGAITSPPGHLKCQSQPPFTVNLGSPDTFIGRFSADDAFYFQCHGRPNAEDAITYWSYDDGSLRRQHPGEPAAKGAREQLSLYIQYREQGIATFWLTWFHTDQNGNFCRFRLPMWTDGVLDQRANECFHAMTSDAANAR